MICKCTHTKHTNLPPKEDPLLPLGLLDPRRDLPPELHWKVELHPLGAVAPTPPCRWRSRPPVNLPVLWRAAIRPVVPFVQTSNTRQEALRELQKNN